MWVPGLMEAIDSAEGETFRAPIRMAVKTVVWTAKPRLAATGYTVPKDEAEPLALTDKITSTGVAPWCLGMKSDPAAGWGATDWTEEYVLRIGDPTPSSPRRGRVLCVRTLCGAWEPGQGI